MVRTILRVVLHTAVFVIAFFTFILGLGIGLAVNPAAAPFCGYSPGSLVSPMSSGLWPAVGVAPGTMVSRRRFPK